MSELWGSTDVQEKEDKGRYEKEAYLYRNKKLTSNDRQSE